MQIYIFSTVLKNLYNCRDSKTTVLLRNIPHNLKYIFFLCNYKEQTELYMIFEQIIGIIFLSSLCLLG